MDDKPYFSEKSYFYRSELICMVSKSNMGFFTEKTQRITLDQIDVICLETVRCRQNIIWKSKTSKYIFLNKKNFLRFSLSSGKFNNIRQCNCKIGTSNLRFSRIKWCMAFDDCENMIGKTINTKVALSLRGLRKDSVIIFFIFDLIYLQNILCFNVNLKRKRKKNLGHG